MAGSVAQRMLSRFDLIHPPQFWIEGTGPSNYARTDISGKGIAPFQRGDVNISNAPEFVDNLYAGKLDRQGVIKVWEENTITISGRVINGTEGWRLLQWAATAPPLTYSDSKTDNATNRKPHQSRTWMFSFQNSDNQIVYLVAKGCKPQNAKLSFPNKGIAMLELTLSTKSIIATQGARPTDLTEDDTNFPAGDATEKGFESGGDSDNVQFELDEPCDRPLRFQDLGKFIYKTSDNNLAFDSLDLGVDWQLRRQNSNGSDRSLFVDHAGRTGTGTIALYKKGNSINEEARSDNLYYAWVELGASETADVESKIVVAGTGANSITFFANAPGSLGNGHEIEFNANAASGVTENKLTITDSSVSGKKKIVVTPKNGYDTWPNLIAFVNGHCATQQIGRLKLKGSVTQPSAAITTKKTAGGSDGASKLIFSNFKFMPSWEPLLEQTDATLESKSIQADTIDVVIV